MIDPVHALAFSIQGNPGINALLLGSGVSRASGIPTGWEITLDLVRKLAALHGTTPDLDPESWYIETYGREPDYSDLLDEITRTPAERQQLLREYFEPTEQEREEGRKQPTEAHRAIAALAAEGYIKVILTTNFDRLMENALKDAGIEPAIISSPDQVEGALPLVHTTCCVVKLHGDYLDTRIRNTSAELLAYPPEFNKLLDQVFDEFGLVVCGWSADWDKALCEALYRCRSRRFTTYWAARGAPSDEAQRLINHRKADIVSMENADAFFQTLQGYVEAVSEFSRPHPLSTEATVAALKRYMSENKYRIQFSDLVEDAVRKVIQGTSGDDFTANTPGLNGEAFAARVRKYDGICSTLLAIAPVAGYWAEREHYAVWERALSRLATTDERGGSTIWLSFKRYPALLLLLGLSIGALEAGRLDFMGHLFTIPLYDENRGNSPAVLSLAIHCLPGDADNYAKSLPSMDRTQFPMSEWIRGVIQQHTKDIIPSESQFTLSYTKLELLLALGFAHHGVAVVGDWVPPGQYFRLRDHRNRILQEFQDSLAKMGNDSPFVKSRIFGDTADACSERIDKLVALLDRIPRFRWG